MFKSHEHFWISIRLDYDLLAAIVVMATAAAAK